MRIFLKRYGYELSNPTVHKYMNTILKLRAIIMRKRPGYKGCHKHKIFDNLLKQNYPKGIILHSDQGCQFTSRDFVAFCKSNGIIQSMSRAGCPYDNAPMEVRYR